MSRLHEHGNAAPVDIKYTFTSEKNNIYLNPSLHIQLNNCNIHRSTGVGTAPRYSWPRRL